MVLGVDILDGIDGMDQLIMINAIVIDELITKASKQINVTGNRAAEVGSAAGPSVAGVVKLI